MTKMVAIIVLGLALAGCGSVLTCSVRGVREVARCLCEQEAKNYGWAAELCNQPAVLAQYEDAIRQSAASVSAKMAGTACAGVK